jgi:hypothetical protein
MWIRAEMLARVFAPAWSGGMWGKRFVKMNESNVQAPRNRKDGGHEASLAALEGRNWILSFNPEPMRSELSRERGEDKGGRKYCHVSRDNDLLFD